MKSSLLHFIARFFGLVAFLLVTKAAYSSHAQSADITYTCVGGNTYNVRLSFYRDCAGVAAPNTVTINIASASCNENFNITMNRIANTGNDVTPICPGITTNCNGGSYPGVQEWIYEGPVTLPAQCTDWVLSFTLCCRNNAISTINNPGGENIYVEAHLDNAQFPCNNSAQFSNKPVPFICVNQTYCFNHGAVDPDGDSLVYELVPPATGPGTNVTYFAGYSANQPLLSIPGVTINQQTGDICMTPSMLEVTVMAVKVSEFRNGEFVGSVVRDIQVRVIACSNSNPSVSGINGSNNYSTSICAGNTLTFNVQASDPDAGQLLTLTWNNAIPGATFTSTTGTNPVGTFTWTPNANQISTNPYCFTVSVSDDNCPLNGSQTYSFCITVNGFTLTTNSTNANCGASNGTVSASVSGTVGQVNYVWSSGQNTPNVNGLSAGNYTVTVSDGSGCAISSTAVVGQGAVPGNIQMQSTNVSCFGGSDGTATVNVNGGQQPYTYLWSNGATSTSINNLSAGNYSVTVTTANGCTTTGTISITQPNAPLNITLSATAVSCNGGNNGTATVVATGGSSPYNYQWSNQSTNASINSLTAGNYSVTVMDAGGCTQTANINVDQPQAISLIQSNTTPVSCFGGNNGSASVSISGGTSPYSYQWNNGVNSLGANANNLTAGNYTVTVTDGNNCQQSFNLAVTQPQPLTATIGNSSNVSCNGSNDGSATSMANGGTAPYVYQWNTVPAQNTPGAEGLAMGTYTVMVTDAHNCTASASVNITQPTPLTLTSAGSATICPGIVTTISANANGGSGNYLYHWNNGNSTASSQQVSPTATTIYSVYATDANGCISPTENITITVNDINVISFGITLTPSICEGQAAVVLAEIAGGIGNYSITWNNGLPASVGPHTIYPTNSGYYTATITDICNNQRTESAWIDVHPLPQVQLTPQNADECGEASLTLFNDFSNDPGSDYNWNFGDGTTSSQEIPTHIYHQSGTYVVTLTVTNIFTCVNSDSTSVVINVRPRSTAEFSMNDNDISIFDPEAQFINNSLQASTAHWDFGDGSSSSLYSPNHTYATTGTYTVTLIANNNFNCPDTISHILIVSPEFTYYVPNAFTPDGDGRNDVFFGKGENIDEFEMLIFNRWGELVFSTQSKDAAWDGTYRGSEEPKQDVYVYKIKIKDSVKGDYHFYEGHVAIVK